MWMLLLKNCIRHILQKLEIGVTFFIFLLSDIKKNVLRYGSPLLS